MSKYLIAALIFLCIVINVFCGKPKREVVLNKADEIRLDTIFNNMKDSLNKVYDPLCEENYKQYFKEAIDSIRVMRLEEIRTILSK